MIVVVDRLEEMTLIADFLKNRRIIEARTEAPDRFPVNPPFRKVRTIAHDGRDFRATLQEAQIAVSFVISKAKVEPLR